MKLNKAEIYTGSNVIYNPRTTEAWSYGWWQFVKLLDGKVIFNNYYYSNTTSKHQSKVRSLLATLGVTVHESLPVPKGLQTVDTLEELYVVSEEYLCDKWLSDLVKGQERRDRTRATRLLASLREPQPSTESVQP